MLKISHIVEDIVKSDEVALYAITHGYLNLSAYAGLILKQVSHKTRKRVGKPSIVVALSRLKLALGKAPPVLPLLEITSISTQIGLVEMAFFKTPDIYRVLSNLYKTLNHQDSEFFSVTQGVGEVSVIAPVNRKKLISQTFKNHSPKLIKENLASLTVRFSAKYIDIPNTTYAFTRILAIQSINVVEVVSTFTEITYILDIKDLQKSHALLLRYFAN